MNHLSTYVKSAAVAATAALAAAGLVGCSGDDSDVLTVCTDLPYEPFQYRDDDGEVVGFDVDIVDLVAEELGQEQEFVDSGFESIVSGEALTNNTCDISAAAITITEEREEVVAFSDPYYDSFQALAVLPDSDVTDLADMDGMQLGVQGETTGHDYASEHEDEHGYEVVSFETLGEQREALLNGSIEGAVNDVPVWLEEVEKDPDSLVVAGEYDTGEQYGLAVALDNDELLDTVNSVLAEAMDDGTYDEIYEKWFGELPTDS